MRYVEPIKSFLLFFLVGLSLTLTIMIWNYKPNHQFIEKSAVENVVTHEIKSVKAILKPYRAVARVEDTFKGTTSTSYIDSILSYFENEQATDLTLVNNNLSIQQINELMSINNRLMLFSSAEIPLQSFINILPFETEDLPEMSFDRIIIDWNNVTKSRELMIFFLNTTNQTLYRTSIRNQGESKVLTKLVEPTKSFYVYTEVKRANFLSLYTPTNSVEAAKYMYLVKDIPIEKFKRILFQDQDIVQFQLSDDTSTTKYNDNLSFMNVDTKNFILNYVYVPSEGLASIAPSMLLDESFSFINEHGGYNGDYRLSLINTAKHIVDYQLYFQGLPVLSAETATKISTTWGDEEVHKYRRPYYVLERDIPSETKVKELPSGVDIAKTYIHSQANVKDLVLGYYLIQNIDLQVFELEPAWFILKENSWERIRFDDIGGMTNGLE
mgnify:FL=1